MPMRVCGSDFAISALDSQFGMLISANIAGELYAVRLFVKVFDCFFTASFLGIPPTIGVMNHHMSFYGHKLPPFSLRIIDNRAQAQELR